MPIYNRGDAGRHRIGVEARIGYRYILSMVDVNVDEIVVDGATWL